MTQQNIFFKWVFILFEPLLLNMELYIVLKYEKALLIGPISLRYKNVYSIAFLSYFPIYHFYQMR